VFLPPKKKRRTAFTVTRRFFIVRTVARKGFGLYHPRMLLQVFGSLRARANSPLGYRVILRIGLPLIAGMLSTTLMEFTDRLFLSRYSLISIAAALPAAAAAMVPQLALAGLCGYVSTLIAQYAGAGRPERIGCVLWQGIWISLAGALLLALSSLGADALFAWVGHDPETAAQEAAYFSILNVCGLFFLLNSVFGGFFTGLGTTRAVLLVNLAGTLLNIPLDYALIFGWSIFPELGIRGAAIATVCGQAFSTLVFAALIARPANLRRCNIPRGFRPDREMILRLLRFGTPSGINMSVDLLAFTWFILEVGKLGQAALAASNLAFSINMLIFMPMLGMTSAVSVLTGKAMGRGRPEDAIQVTQNALHLSLFYMLPVAVCCAFFGGPLLDLFLGGDPGPAYQSVRETGIVLLYYVAAYSLVDACNIVYLGALKGAGDTVAVLLLLGGAALFCLVLPIAALKALDLVTLHSLWLAFTAYVVIMALAARLRFGLGKWRNIRMI
jgi:MATE family multidrug resistance protein